MKNRWESPQPDKEHVQKSKGERERILSPKIRNKAKPHPFTPAIQWALKARPGKEGKRRKQKAEG